MIDQDAFYIEREGMSKPIIIKKVSQILSVLHCQ
jgi:hypothetical protein